MNTMPSEIGRRGPAWLQCNELDRKGPGERNQQNLVIEWIWEVREKEDEDDD